MVNISDIVHDGVIVGIEIDDGKQKVFIERDPGISEHEVLAEIEKIKSNTSLCLSDGYAHTDEGSIIGIGRHIKTKLFPTQARMTLSGGVKPNPRLQTLRDEGTLGKNNWRFQMAKYVSTIFGRTIPKDSGVVFMPGMGREEFGLWGSFQVDPKQMYLIEGDSRKVAQIIQKYPQACHIHSFLGKGDESFSRTLIESLDDIPVSVLSFDTEISLSQGLLQDLAGIIANMNIGENIFLMINIVQRGSHNLARKIIDSQQSDNNVLGTAMSMVPDRLIEMSGRYDLSVLDSQSGSYLGGSSSTMNYVFCHIQKK